MLFRSADFISAYLADNNLTTVKEFDNYKNIFLVSGPNEPPKTSIVESIVFDDPKGISLLDYTYVQDNQPLSTTTFSLTEDKNWWKVASVNSIDLTKETDTIPVRGSKTVVYLMDSGVELTHPEFVGRNVSNLFSLNGDRSEEHTSELQSH